MNYKHQKIINLNLSLYKYWRPSSYSDPNTPTSWKCSIAEISYVNNNVKLYNFLTDQSITITTTMGITKNMKNIDNILNNKN